VITFEHVDKRYPGQKAPALRDVNLTIEQGEFAFLIGPSGSGKTTCLRLLLREIKPSRGRILVDGRDITRMRRGRVPHLRRRVGMVFQDFRLLPSKTVYENVAFALRVIGKPSSQIRQLVPEALELVGLEAFRSRMPNELSGGEQQRVALARAFVNRPPVLLADEPTGNLDPENSETIMSLLDRINRTGTTVVMASHDQPLVDQMRRRVVQLSEGVVVRDQARGGYG
jgi:cell division transport system ATP-binding protein